MVIEFMLLAEVEHLSGIPIRLEITHQLHLLQLFTAQRTPMQTLDVAQGRLRGHTGGEELARGRRRWSRAGRMRTAAAVIAAAGRTGAAGGALRTLLCCLCGRGRGGRHGCTAG